MSRRKGAIPAPAQASAFASLTDVADALHELIPLAESHLAAADARSLLRACRTCYQLRDRLAALPTAPVDAAETQRRLLDALKRIDVSVLPRC